MLNKIDKNQLLNFVFIFIIFSIDRLSKLLIINLSNSNEPVNINLASFLNLNLVWNEGIAFGLLSFDDSFGYNLITFIILIVIVILIIMLIKSERISRLALIMVLGGALGNFFDRVYYSAVPDFIEFYYKSFHWFIFNVADIFITIGIICLIYVEIINNDKTYEKKK